MRRTIASRRSPAVALLAALLPLACQKAPQNQAGSTPADSTLGTPATDSAARSATRFAQAFYDWYGGQGDKYEVALRDSAAAFEPTLFAAMRADLEAQAHNPDEVVGLDWDPFLATQDPCDPYRVQETSRRGDTILVTVRGTCSDRPAQAGPDVIAEVGRLGGRWVFLDFRHVGDNGGLRQDLARLRDERAAAARRTAT